MEVLLKFTVDRRRWLRGEGEEDSMLLRSSDGKMCCLGFACLAAGHTEDEIRDVATPSGLTKSGPSWESPRSGRCLLPNHAAAAISSVMTENDRLSGDDARREAFITEKLAGIGIEVTFEG